jgi:hypothetical protein
MATNNSINLKDSGAIRYDGAGTFAASTLTNHATLIGGASSAITSVLQGAGQLLIGTTAGDPTAAALTAGTGVAITSASGSITINTTGGGMTWTVVTGTSQSVAVNNGYIANNAGLVTFTMPTTSAVGDVFEITGMSTDLGWKIAQSANQQIFYGISSTTSGVTGSLASTKTRDTVKLVCIVANLTWNVVFSIGNITVV